MAANTSSYLGMLENTGLSFYAPFSDKGNGEVSLVAAGAGNTIPTFTRSTIATTIGSTGLIIPVSSGVARSYYDPTTLQYMGYLAEGARTNLVLNSLINGTDFSTQSVNVTAVAHTLSFYGTGTITLSGASTAGPLVGTGVYPQRVSLTFTPSAASLTLTVTGSCKYVQLEVGTFASTFIPTAGTAVTRDADVLTYPFAGNASATVGTAYAELGTFWATAPATSYALLLSDGNGRLLYNGGGVATGISNFDGTSVLAITGSSMNTGTRKAASAWGGSTKQIVMTGSTVSSGAFDGTMGPGTGDIFVGNISTNAWFGTLKNVRIWQNQFTAAQLSAITSG